MNAWKVILATLVIFTAGFFTGGLFTNRCEKSFRAHRLAALDAAKDTNRVSLPPPEQIPGMRKDFVKRLDRELHLSPEQREHIEKFVSDGQDHIKDLWDLIAPDCHTEWVATKEKIRAELTEEQKVQFVEFMKNPRKKQPSTNAPPRDVSALAPTNAAAVLAP